MAGSARGGKATVAAHAPGYRAAHEAAVEASEGLDPSMATSRTKIAGDERCISSDYEAALCKCNGKVDLESSSGMGASNASTCCCGQTAGSRASCWMCASCAGSCEALATHNEQTICASNLCSCETSHRPSSLASLGEARTVEASFVICAPRCHDSVRESAASERIRRLAEWRGDEGRSSKCWAQRHYSFASSSACYWMGYVDDSCLGAANAESSRSTRPWPSAQSEAGDSVDELDGEGRGGARRAS
eukprot:4954462-Prymnesium_polylepis.5